MSEVNVDDKARVKLEMARVRDSLRVTKVVATRALKTSKGDMFVGMSAGWNSTQEDGQQDMVHTTTESDAVNSENSMSLKEAKVAAHLLALQVNITAYEQAAAAGVMSGGECAEVIRALRANFSSLTSQAILGSVKRE